MSDFECMHDSEGCFEIIKIFLVYYLEDWIEFLAMGRFA
jgi:hypothetical protein